MAIRSLRRLTRDIIIRSLVVVCLYHNIGQLHRLSITFHSVLLPLNAEVEHKAASPLKNIAQWKAATQSSTLGDFSASRAIDGKIDTFSHTNDSNAWLEIDMGDLYPISYVEIANRWCLDPSDLTGCLCRLSGVKLSLTDYSDYVVATESIGNACTLKTATVTFDTCSTPAQSHQTKPSCLPFAKKLKLQSTTGKQINVFEVRVFSPGISNYRQTNNLGEIPAESKTIREIEGSNNSTNIAINKDSHQESFILKSHFPTRKKLNASKASAKASETVNTSDSSRDSEPFSKLPNPVQYARSKSVHKGQNHSTKVKVDTKTDVKKYTSKAHPHSTSYDVTTPTGNTLVNNDDKYLLFYNHDGFSNQIIGLNGAITLAAKTGRTLVLPPITPHYTTDKRTLKYPLTYRPGGDLACNKSFETIKADIGMLAHGNEFPAWSELFDFTADRQDQQFRGKARFGVPVIELSDFVRKNVTQGSFDEIEMLCNNLPYPIEDISTYKHESSSQVVYAGSMFNLGSRVYVPFWKPSRQIFDILRQIFSRVYTVDGRGGRAGLLPKDYIGLHVRLDDQTMMKQEFNCKAQQFIDKLGNIRHLLRRYIDHGRVIFLGTSTKTIKDCIVTIATSYDKEYLKELGNNHTSNKYTTQVVVMEDILNYDIVVSKLIEKIRVEKSTVLLVLDQFLIGLAQDIMKINMLSHLSTYQYFVEEIHEETYRNHLISQLFTQRKAGAVGYFEIV